MTYEEFVEKYNIKLTDQQKEAVINTDGPLCLESVPGSGKTTVLVARLGYMILVGGIKPETILNLTYTVNSTREMKKRFGRVFGEELSEKVEFRTLNGECQKLIYEFCKKTGKTPYRLITEEKEKNGILTNLYRKIVGGYAAENDIKQLSLLVTYCKNSLLTREQIISLGSDYELPLIEIFEGYQKELARLKAYDYDDQLITTYKLLTSVPDLLRLFQKRIKYINVDECQDTSIIQHRIMDLMTQGIENIFEVGDLDQSIYGFRGAAPEELLSFEHRHPGAKIIFMEDNFRSDGKIVKLADTFIQKNTKRRPKHIKATRPDCNEVEIIELGNRIDQYDYLMHTAVKLSERNQIAILYNENESAVPLIDLLERNGIPYNLKKSDGVFFTHKVVQDIVNILMFAYNPYSEELFMQLYYKLNLHLNKQQAIDICRYSREHNVPLLEVCRYNREFPLYLKNNCDAAAKTLSMIRNERADRAILRIEVELGYGDYLFRNHISDGKLAILRSLGKYTSTPKDLITRLEDLQNIVKTKENDWTANLTLSTIHSSKGLEYNTVYLMDVFDGNLPESVPPVGIALSEEDLRIYEEERRKFYVGITRAKNKLFLISYRDCPSAFIKECKQILLAGTAQIMKHYEEARRPQRRMIGSALPGGLDDYIKQFSIIGSRIHHDTWGNGVITDATDKYVDILFDGGEDKKFDYAICFKFDLLKRI